ncbi:MAG: DegT/DnrJ/EryC1/StrS family aminotransferase [Lachnospiraceae bacterium]
MLAINGGKKIGLVSDLSWPLSDSSTLTQLESVLKSGRWAISGQWKGGKTKCELFEEAYAKFNHINYCAAFDHGSSSLLAAMQGLGIGPGDEVIIPALTWVACIISICNINATPVVVDIDPNTYCISPEEIRKAITPRTKAIMPVHLYGCMADMHEIMKIAKENNLYVIEDASHSHGSVWENRYAGSIGDVGCFSFQQGKVLTCGEGGAVITSEKNLYDKLIEIRTNSRLYKEQKECTLEHMHLYESGKILGTNYCISEFQAAVLLDQLSKLENWNKIKEDNAKYLDTELSKIDGVSTMYHDKRVDKQSYYRYCIKVDNRYFADKPVKRICQALEAELGIVIEQPYPSLNKNVLYKPETLQTYKWSEEYAKRIRLNNEAFPCAERAAFNEGVIFHHSYLLGNSQDMDRVVEAFAKVQKYAEEL